MDVTFNQSEVMDALDVISHHGILGMKWGKQNGPPYPLDEHQKSSAEKRAAKDAYDKLSPKKKREQKRAEYERMSDDERKKRIMDDADAEMAIKYDKLFSTQELQVVYNRALLKTKITELRDKELTKEQGSSKIKKVGKTLAATTGTLTNINGLAKILGISDNAVQDVARVAWKPVDKAFTNAVFDAYTWAFKQEDKLAASKAEYEALLAALGK